MIGDLQDHIFQGVLLLAAEDVSPWTRYWLQVGLAIK